MNIPFYQVDAFTKIPFKGNPAAVCIVDDTVTETLMQQIAAENNLSETAFVCRREESFDLRWFTPQEEVALCGHGTLATAHLLWEQGIVPKQQTITFNTLSGWLSAQLNNGWVELNFPSLLGHQVPLPREIQDILQVNPVNTVFALNRYVIELATEAEVRALTPDFARLANFPRIVITAKGDKGTEFDFVSRVFAPCIGINEDPVTGSAHCALAPYWAQQLGKQSMTAYQASARGGVVKLRQEGERTVFSGEAVTVIKGTYTLNPSYATATLSN